MTIKQKRPYMENDNSRELYHILKQSQSKATGKVYIKGELVVREVHSVPIEFLRYNTENFRIRDELDMKRARNNNVLFDTEDEIQKWVETKLIDVDDDKNEAIYNDIKANGLKEPVVVRLSDGTVMDGNRRLMTHRKLVNDGEAKFNEIDAICINEELSDQEWLELEAWYQYQRDTKSHYDPINDAKMLTELYNIYRDYEVVASKYDGKSKKYVEQRINTLQLIDDYLNQIGLPNAYHLIPSFTLFDELAKNIAKNTEIWSPEELKRAKNTGLNLISYRKAVDLQKENNINGDGIRDDFDGSDDLAIDDRIFRELLKARGDVDVEATLIQNIDPEYVYTIDEISAEKKAFGQDIRQALLIKEEKKLAEEPVRMITMAINKLKAIQKIRNDERDPISKALKEISEELKRILALLQADQLKAEGQGEANG